MIQTFPAQPLVSVILPVYNGSTLVERAIRSVLGQTYAHLELWVIDDGSTDETPRLLMALRHELADLRLHVFRQVNGGTASARNTGMALARGTLLAFIDSDDVWLPHKLADDVATLQASPDPVGLVYCGYEALDDQDQLIFRPPLFQPERGGAGNLLAPLLARESIMLPSTTVLHRHVVETVGGFHTGCFHEDREFFIRACQKFPAYTTGRRAVLYRQSTQGKCRGLLTDEQRALREELAIVDALDGVLPDDQLADLRRVQLRNLFFRFLMYNKLTFAERLYPQLDRRLLRKGLKGWLAELSMRTHWNALATARLLVQTGVRSVLHPMASRQWASWLHTVRPRLSLATVAAVSEPSVSGAPLGEPHVPV